MMGEVEVDAEVEQQQDVSSVDPEPLLIILSPPPPFLPAPGEPTMFWHKWLKAFEHYAEALGGDELVDSGKHALFHSCLGLEGQRVSAALLPGETTYAAAVSALTVYFRSDRGSQMRRLQFHQRAQKPGETADLFVSALEDLLRPCNYGDLQDQLVLDQLIEKTNCPQLGERLLSERGTLTRDKALVIGKEVEFALSGSELFGYHEVSVDIGDDLDPPVPIKRKRGRPRRGEGRPKEHATPLWTKTRTRSARAKDDGYYGNDMPRHRENDDTCKSGGEARDKDARENNGALSSQRMEEEGRDNASEEEEDDDDDEDFYPSKLKGPNCPVCVDKRFRDANKLARHMRTHTQEKPFGCPVCAATFSQSYHMTRHMRKQHGAGRYICPTCGKSSESFAGLQSHKRTHGSRAPSRPDRGETSAEDRGKDREVKESRDKDSDDDDDDDDESGDDVAKNDADSDDGDSHGGEPKADVKTEEKDGDGRTEAVARETKTKGHRCPVCVGRRFRGPNKLARHMRTHTKEKPFGCPVCAATFSQSYHMTRHLRKQHGLGQYICVKCGTCFGSWLELRAHKKTHAVEGLTCLSCDKQFKGKAALASHLKLHKKVAAGPRSLVCDDCGKRFGRMYHLKRHAMTHRRAAGGEAYACPDCRKNFALPEDLNKHLEGHVKENSGTCPKCGETFGSPEELEAHAGPREVLPLRHLREEVQGGVRAEEARAGPPGRAALLLAVPQALLQAVALQEARDGPRPAGVQVPALRQRLPAADGAQVPPADSHGRAAAPVHLLHGDLRGAGGAPAAPPQAQEVPAGAAVLVHALRLRVPDAAGADGPHGVARRRAADELPRVRPHVPEQGQAGEAPEHPLGGAAAPVRRVRQRLPVGRQPQAARPHPHRGEAVRVRAVRQELRLGRRAAAARPAAHGGAAQLRVPRVRPDVRPHDGAEDAPALPHGRQAVRLHLLQQALHQQRQAERPHADPHGREAVRLPPLRPDVHADRRPQQTRQQIPLEGGVCDYSHVIKNKKPK
ncbi:zinc finger and SCAN domain-containing protein 12-like [Pseudoliparis swirei]|uniref:zinc finger and SCAN domain-containing protein 12-like n=1 Tax=Pseudoliparis swirei TaxID=2059687 RepID=UPI0024BECB69|nr:zinc finger and SCAN domain-containing protein 12-like [Pseudoliparis swirei]XP_056264463.1 zinc finger and SCAN domain-containing protein 12-like [Pseudoliparis swirei]